ncbi:MAG: site-specific integrase [Alcaligenaceae bacterium]|nr:site-specific integrase [Alcaligenaceae bacterium]
MVRWPFKEIWLADYEFAAAPGERPVPLCLVAKELLTGRTVRRWGDGLKGPAPFDLGPQSLYVVYYASAEMGCHLALGWPLPANVLDLYAEFRVQTNGRVLPKVKLESRSYETHASIYRNHIQPQFGDRRLNEIDGDEIVDYAGQLRQKRVSGGRWEKSSTRTLSEGTVKRILILVRHIFNEAIRIKGTHVTVNPTHAIKLTTVRKIVGKFLTQAQLKALLKAAEGSQNPDLPDIIRVMGATGLRRDNVLAMRWSWFDEARATLTVPVEDDKAKKGFVLHLSAGVLEVLRNRMHESASEWVFSNPQTGKPYYSCRNAWVTAREKAGLPGLRMHDLRHTYASMMLDSGSDIVDVQQALGHTQLKTTAGYLHLTEGRKRHNANAAAQATGLFA